MLSSLNKLFSNFSKDQFKETRKHLESFYVQQPNQPQTNNMTVGGEESKGIHAHEGYKTTLTICQQSYLINNNKSKKTWRWWREEELTDNPYRIPLNDFKSYGYDPKTPSIVY